MAREPLAYPVDDQLLRPEVGGGDHIGVVALVRDRPFLPERREKGFTGLPGEIDGGVEQ